MTRQPPSPEALARLRRIIAITAVSLMAISIGLALAELWPTPWVDELGFRWFGASSWRLRIVGNFAVLGGLVVLPVLVVALIVKRLVLATRR